MHFLIISSHFPSDLSHSLSSQYDSSLYPNCPNLLSSHHHIWNLILFQIDCGRLKPILYHLDSGQIISLLFLIVTEHFFTAHYHTISIQVRSYRYLSFSHILLPLRSRHLRSNSFSTLSLTNLFRLILAQIKSAPSHIILLRYQTNPAQFIYIHHYSPPFLIDWCRF